MSALDTATADLVAWARAGAETPWPAAADGLLDIASTALADLGLSLPAPGGRPDGQWVAGLYAVADRLAALDGSTAAAARSREALRMAQVHAGYHSQSIAQAIGGLDRIGAAWDGPSQAAIRVSLAELIAHLATGFARHGRVPHCGAVGRTLLAGAIAHDGPDRYLPPRPPYRYVGDNMAEVQLHFDLPIFVDTQDDSVCPDIIRTGWWEPWIDGIVKKCIGRGDIAVNVGANVGYYMLLMANLVQDAGRVFAFEANPRLIRLLQRSLTWGGLRAMTKLMPFAASNVRGVARFVASRQNMGGGGLTQPKMPGIGTPRERQVRRLRAEYPMFDEDDLVAMNERLAWRGEAFAVHTTTLDDTVGRLVREIHFMLIDAEGSEPLVLDGGRDLIRRSRDLAMVIEWSNGAVVGVTPQQRTQAAATIGWLAADGFRFWRIDGDPRDVYARPAILTPMTPDEVLDMPRYGDLFACRQPAG